MALVLAALHAEAVAVLGMDVQLLEVDAVALDGEGVLLGDLSNLCAACPVVSESAIVVVHADGVSAGSGREGI